MELKCVQCGKTFESKRSDAKFCSPACKQAHHRLANLTINGIIIRGQHENDVPPTKLGIIAAKCWTCGAEFPRWIEAKLARLVRTEIEGTPITKDWGSREDFAKVRERFDCLMEVRLHEVKFCSELCQGTWAPRKDWGGLKPVEIIRDEKKPDPGQNGKSDPNVTPKRRGS